MTARRQTPFYIQVKHAHMIESKVEKHKALSLVWTHEYFCKDYIDNRWQRDSILGFSGGKKKKTIGMDGWMDG